MTEEEKAKIVTTIVDGKPFRFIPITEDSPIVSVKIENPVMIVKSKEEGEEE